MDRLQVSLAEKNQLLEQLKAATQTAEHEVRDAKEIWVLTEYRPEIISKLVERIRVFDGGRIELELKNDVPAFN